MFVWCPRLVHYRFWSAARLPPNQPQLLAPSCSGLRSPCKSPPSCTTITYFDPHTQRTVISRDVYFDDQSLIERASKGNEDWKKSKITRQKWKLWPDLLRGRISCRWSYMEWYLSMSAASNPGGYGWEWIRMEQDDSQEAPSWLGAGEGLGLLF